jgi:predicted GNAT family N-acyltransferase
MNYSIIITSWKENQQALSQIRQTVFIEEQHVPEELEWDNEDKDCVHVLALNDNKPAGVARIKKDGHIGRMAVLKNYRKKGIGSALLNKLTAFAQSNNYTKLYLHAQVDAIKFYKKHGFKVCSQEFMDAGIPHMTMEKRI